MVFGNIWGLGEIRNAAKMTPLNLFEIDYPDFPDHGHFVRKPDSFILPTNAKKRRNADLVYCAVIELQKWNFEMPKRQSKINDDGGELAGITFETAVEKLEEIVDDLEQNLSGLDQSLARYEEGVRLIRHAHALLAGAGRKIELLRGVDEEGNAVTAPVDEREFLSDTSIPGRSSGMRNLLDSEDDLD